MPDNDARDSWFEVELDLPNGAKIKGRSIPWRKGMDVKRKLIKYADSGADSDMDDLWASFSELTAITEQEVMRLCPSITLIELTDLISRFIYLLRPGRTAAPSQSGTPASIAAPAAAGPTAG